MIVSFSCPGLPAAQGSKNPWGGEASKTLKPWRNDVKVAGLKAMGEEPPFLDPVVVGIVFVFPRPKAHFGTGRNAGKLKNTAPIWVAKTPDLDKLIRAIGDALTGVVWKDDSLIVRLVATKTYGNVPGVKVTAEPLLDQHNRILHASGGDGGHAAGVERMIG